MELDLAGGLRIAGKGCDCGKKHSLGIEALSEELIPMDRNPTYNRILGWLEKHAKEFEPATIDATPVERYQALAGELRTFRKDILGTENLGALLSESERSMVIGRLKNAALP